MRKFYLPAGQSLRSVLLLLLAMCLFTRCQKENLHNPDANLEIKESITTAMIKKDFSNADLASRLIDTLNDTLQIIYIPNWNKITTNKMGDSLDYRFIPLHPIAKSPSGQSPVNLIGHKAFLLVKNGKEFYRSRFYPKPVGQITNDSTLFLYNGRLALDDLLTDQLHLIDYNLGKTSQNFIKQVKLNDKHGLSNKTASKKSGKNTTMGWEQVCYTVRTCNWYTVCQGVPHVYSNFTGECSYPTVGTSCDYTAEWYQSTPSYHTVCENIYFADPPTDDNGGTGTPPIITPTPPEGFRPLCMSSISLVPKNSTTKEVHLKDVKFGITDVPLIGPPKTNVITFNIYINIPFVIANPDDRTKNYTFTDQQLKEFIYEAYHYASEMTNLGHGQDFFDPVIAQTKYRAIFAQNMQFYFNFIALEGMFRVYENMHEGVVPSLSATTGNTIDPAKAKVAVYTNATSGKGC
ncbi:hypothetical protein [Olivibacter jilunii]|uniref:hypothetical protein n=1 Tax=Olivibacter jilunii TaxID=985016 RepID=UPI001032760E|nr:hypothetical protein [Olivibacter jilunii]